MKKLSLLTAGVILLAAATYAQRPGAHPLTPRQQRLIDRASAPQAAPGAIFSANVHAKSTAGATRERLRAIFVDYSGGLDSINYFYGSPYRGSSYDYSKFDQYSGGYLYLAGILNPSIQFDSVHYITQPGYTGPFIPYFNAYASYASDTAQMPLTGHLDQANSMGVLSHSQKFDRVYTTSGLIVKEVRYNWDAGLQQYDSSSITINNYSGAGLLQSRELYYYNPLRTGTRTIFYYDATGNVTKQDDATYDAVNNLYNPTGRTLYSYTTSGYRYRTDVYAYNSATGLYSSLPHSSTILSFTPAGFVADSLVQTAGQDTVRTSYTYNGAGQQASIAQAKLVAGAYAYLNKWDTSEFSTFSYPSATSGWTRQRFIVKDPNNYDPDSTIRTLDAGGQILLQKSLYSANGLDEGAYTLTYTYYAPGKIATYAAVSTDPVAQDTFSNFISFTYTAAGNPLTRSFIYTDAYGQPVPDSFNNWKDHYYYETVTLPDTVHTTGISHSVAKEATLKVFPNPTTGMLRLTCGEMGDAMLTITNGNGQAVRSHAVKLGADVAVLDVSALPAGLYFISLRCADGGMANTKFIRQ